MHTESNPQQPAATTTTAAPPEVATTAGKAASQPAAAAPKPTSGNKPAAKQLARQRAATRPTAAKKPAAKASKPTKAPEKAPSVESAPTTLTKAPREGSTMWAILKVLGSAKEPLSAKEIYAEIATCKLAPGLKGKTPDQTIAAKLAVSAKNGEYVERAAPGKFQLLKGWS